jgi:hypothetical protein
MHLEGEWILVCMLCDSRHGDLYGAWKMLKGTESEGSKANGLTDNESEHPLVCFIKYLGSSTLKFAVTGDK